ncbi:MAG: HYR domain-containing protein, partial [Saprospiraceae bacterium]|nr:HYR domain-containing protein [Saprospiraceae bacterium]
MNTVLMVVLMTFMSQSLQAQGDCLVPHGGLGCSDPACEATVCAVDPFCCNNSWDSVCASEAAQLCGGAQPTCDDGIQNGNETGVDCGGPDCVPCGGGVVNDDVCSALAIDCGTNQSGTTQGATFDDVGSCGTSNTAPGVWYKWTGDGAQVTVSTCNAGTNYDTKLSVFSGNCEVLSCVGGGDDDFNCSFGSTRSTVTFNSTSGVQYYFLVHGFSSNTGNFELSLTSCAEGLSNDDSCGALSIECGASVTGSTVGATPDNMEFCGTGNTAPGVWYKWTGDGTQVTISTCNAGTNYDTKLSVFSGNCEVLSCVGGSDDDFNCSFSSLRSTVTFTSVLGVQYFFLVHGFGTSTGNFELSLSCEGVCDDAAEGPIVTSCPEGQDLCGAQNVYWQTPTATDNCVEPTVSSNYNSGDFFGVGEHNVVYTFTDGAGLEATCSFKITINPLPQVEIDPSNVPEWCQGVKVLFAKVTNIAALAEPLSFEWYQGENFLGDGQELLVTANGTYTVIVTDDNGCSTTVSTVVNYDLSTLLSAHTIIVDDQLDMDESTVVSGGVGVQDGDEVSVQHNSNIMTFM